MYELIALNNFQNEYYPFVEVVALKRAVFGCHSTNLSSFSTNASCKLDVFGHNGHSLGVDSTQISVFK